MTAVTPTDRPKSVRNRCVIKVFGGAFMLSRCFYNCSVGVRTFVTGLSQVSSFFSFMLQLTLIVRIYSIEFTYIRTEGILWPRQILGAVKVRAIS